MKIAVILSGCGYLDGAEIRESVLSLLYLDIAGAEVGIFAPDIMQHHTINHLSGDEQNTRRNILQEAARIARGDVQPLDTLDPDAFDGLVIPGGFGVAKNLSNFAFNAEHLTIDATTRTIIHAFHSASKPIGAICIAPVIVAAALKEKRITLTIGTDEGCAAAIDSFGNQHQACPVDKAVIDTHHKIASCPAYMMDDASVKEVAKGIEQVIHSVVSMAKHNIQQRAAS